MAGASVGPGIERAVLVKLLGIVVGDAASHDFSWRDFAIHERTGRLAIAEDDFLDLLRQGL